MAKSVFFPVAICVLEKSGFNLRLGSCAEPAWQVHAIRGQFGTHGACSTCHSRAPGV